MAQYELTLRDYIRVIRKRKFLIAFSFVLFAISAAVYISFQTPSYTANATVRVTERKTVGGMMAEWVMVNPGDMMETQTKVVKGFPIIRRVALNTGLLNEKDSPERVYEVVGGLQNKVTTTRIGFTNIIKITATSSDPKGAMQLANAVATAYIEENLLEKNKQARTARKFIEDQLGLLEERLRKSEDELKSFGEKVANVIIAQDIQDKLNELTFQLASFRQKYTEKHPKIMQLKQQIKDIEKQLSGLSGKDLEYARIKREVEVNRKIYGMLREKLEEVRITEAEKTPDVTIVDPALMPVSAENIQSRLGVIVGGFLGLIVGVVLAFVSESLDTSIGTIEDVESLTKLPVLGIIPSIPFKRTKQATMAQKIKRLLFPKKLTHEEQKSLRLLVHYQPSSPIAEAFRNAKANIKISASRKTLMVTSAGPQEGKSTFLVNLALACTQEGLHTLIISADLRRPVIAETFGLAKKPGLSEIIMGTVSFEQALRRSSDIIFGEMGIDDMLKHPGLEYLSLIPAGTLPLNPVEILDSKEMADLLDKLKKTYDVILLDTPPVLPVADASILAPKVDGVLLCYEIGRTSRQALLRAKSQLETAKAKIIGIALNHIKPEIEFTNIDPYYYRYRYTSYPPKEKKGKKEQKTKG
ncbi:MAG: GNVR domain-containing protein [Candidatus Omnitrophota bacterium]